MQLSKEDIGLECRYGPCWLRVSDDDDDDFLQSDLLDRVFRLISDHQLAVLVEPAL